MPQVLDGWSVSGHRPPLWGTVWGGSGSQVAFAMGLVATAVTDRREANRSVPEWWTHECPDGSGPLPRLSKGTVMP